MVPGGLITYSIDYRNDGDKAATNVVLSESVPDNTTFVAAGSTQGGTATVLTPVWATVRRGRGVHEPDRHRRRRRGRR